jgi:6-phosphofructokinase 2
LPAEARRQVILAEFFQALAKAVRHMGAKLVVDSTKPVLNAAIEEGVHFIKPNLRELRDLMDEPLASKVEWIDALRRRVRCVDVGRAGALLVTRDGRLAPSRRGKG